MRIKTTEALKLFLFCMTVGILIGFNPVSAEALDEPDDIRVGGNVIQTSEGRDAHFKGFWLENGAAGGFVRKNGVRAPLIMHDYTFFGTDSNSVALAWDTNVDGQWGYCEGVGDSNPPSAALMNCADYDGLMGPNDIYWVWRHGGWSNRPESYDLKFVFDGESNDGVMGYMEDEDAFFFDEKVGIGTRTPDAMLHVGGSVILGGQGNDDGILDIKANGGTNMIHLDGSSSTADNYIKGNVSIGTTDPQGYKLYVNGTAFFTGSAQSSDAQFKKNISPISSALDKVMNLKGISYEWKTDEYKDRGFEDGRHYGVIAQDVETVLPEIVKENGDGYKGVSYTEMIPVLIEAMKEQQEIIKTLESKIRRLESKDLTASALPQTY